MIRQLRPLNRYSTTTQRRLKFWYNISAFSEEDVGLKNRAGFLVIDNIELHGLVSSISCLGRCVTSYTTRDPKEIAKLLALLP